MFKTNSGNPVVRSTWFVTLWNLFTSDQTLFPNILQALDAHLQVRGSWLYEMICFLVIWLKSSSLCTDLVFLFFSGWRVKGDWGKESIPYPHPIGLVVNKSPVVFILTRARSTMSKEKIEGLWTGYWNYHFVGWGQWRVRRSNEL